jgi:hypothetical protein
MLCVTGRRADVLPVERCSGLTSLVAACFSACPLLRVVADGCASPPGVVLSGLRRSDTATISATVRVNVAAAVQRRHAQAGASFSRRARRLARIRSSNPALGSTLEYFASASSSSAARPAFLTTRSAVPSRSYSLCAMFATVTSCLLVPLASPGEPAAPGRYANALPLL